MHLLTKDKLRTLGIVTCKQTDDVDEFTALVGLTIDDTCLKALQNNYNTVRLNS